jgi:SAM-dependent methyltransferase
MVDLCPACHSPELKPFYEVDAVPAHSVLLLASREEAVGYPTGTICLALCAACGFISNVAFDPGLHEYSSRYEETQGFSPTFNAFHRRLAETLIERYDLRGKEIIEIGCGKGEFLTLLCQLGDNRGLGFDPAYVSERLPEGAAGRVTFIQDFYSEKYAGVQGDFICCKMTLEHIHNPADFVATVRRSAADNPHTVVFFQVPDTARVLRDLAFWDIYYEHCSYFTLGSLARLFRNAGFAVQDLWRDYDDQYLMIAATMAAQPQLERFAGEEDLEETITAVAAFAAHYPDHLARWQQAIQEMNAGGRRVVLWGGGSKGVAFLTTLGLTPPEIEYVVDVNPYKAGHFMAGTGQEVVAPAFLRSYRPDAVIIMNPIYRAEIERELHEMGLSPRIITV